MEGGYEVKAALETPARRPIGRAGWRAAGFTLAGLLVALGIVAAAAATSLPLFSRWLPRYRLQQAGSALYSHFQLARMSAVRAGIPCTVTFGQALEGQSWDYVVYVDADADLEYDSGEEVLVKVRFAERSPGVSLDPAKGGGDGLTFTKNDEGRPSLAFRPNGLPRNNTGGFGAGTAYLINSRGQSMRVIVSSAGNIRIL